METICREANKSSDAVTWGIGVAGRMFKNFDKYLHELLASRG